jgi:acetolactate synthase-1/2/3 large subunit
MNGAESLVATARAAGIEICFANPGTTEMPLVAALDAVGGLRSVLGLFEGVCTGAADGYARMAGRPALALLHLGPGLANGLANLHNARRARSPVVVVVGDHASWHLAADPPLASDVAAVAAPFSRWVRRTGSSRELARDFAEALVAATGPPGGVATLVAPADAQWEPADAPARPPRPAAARGAGDRVEATAARLRTARAPALLLGAEALSAEGLRAAARVAAATGAALWCETFPARLERGRGLPRVARLPYFPEQAVEALAAFDVLALAGAPQPVAFFGYPGGPSRLARAESLAPLAGPEHDAVRALAALADALGAPAAAPLPPDAAPAPVPTTGALDPASLGAVLAALQPEGAIVVDESISSGLPHFAAAEAAPPHSYLALTGGAIGQGLPCAVGAALACPDRKVIALQADGSALYTLQSLWTLAREGLDALVVLLANHRYRILQVELARAKIAEPGPAARALTSLAPPQIDWVGLARSLGVAASRAASVEDLSRALRAALAERGPRLVEVVL